jgi:hypothetical protein
MDIPSYQMHNILNVYSRQISRDRGIEDQGIQGERPSVDKLGLSAGGKRRMVVDKVAAAIIDRISHVDPPHTMATQSTSQNHNGVAEPFATKKQNKVQFVFNVFNDNNEKMTQTLSVEDPSILINRIE